jgi:dTDP-4-amino-4,6-dideoxygalactose transaminase
MKKFPNYLTKIKSNIQLFENSLENSEVFTIIKKYKKTERVYWKFPITIKKNKYQEVVSILKQNDILFENNNYKTLLNENTIYTDFYNINTNGDYKKAVSTKDVIIQLPEFLFYDDGNAEKIIKVFSGNNIR